MRASFIRTLLEIAREDDQVFLLVADIGYNLVEPFAAEFPDRFFNVGIAEQDMMGIAAGLALSGKTVFTYSITNFPVLRCLEQIRNDVCYHNLPVKIVSSGGGLSYGALGVTHHLTEDLAVLRALPNMTVVAPADPVEAGLATRAAARHAGPCYLRLARTGDPPVHDAEPCFQLGTAIRVHDGADATIIACGGMVPVAVKAARSLEERDISVRVLSMHTIKPLDQDAVLAAAKETRAIVTLEEHSIVGGLGSAVSEVLVESAWRPLFRRVGLSDEFRSQVGSQEYLLKAASLTSGDVADVVEQLVRKQ